MATEDIRVEHSASAETAAFDIKNRCLILPIWKDMSNSMYDMLVAHEVSHALNTPFEEWDKVRKTVKNVGAFMQVCNVVEDARIERMIKSAYPGVRKDFSRAYNELNASDLFELEGKDISAMNLIDRLNIEFKLGLFGHVQVPFSADEQSYVTRMANTTTFSDVVELAKELLADWEQDQENQEQEQNGEGESGSGDSGSGDESGQSGSEDWQEAISEDGKSSTSQSTDGAEDDDAETQSGQENSPSNVPNIDDLKGDEDGDNSGDEDGDNSGDENGDNSGEKGEDSDGDGEEGSYNYDDYTNNSGGMPSETQSAFEQGKKNLTDSDAKDRSYCTLPTKMNLDKIIIDYKIIDGIWDKHETRLSSKDGQSQYRSPLSYYNEAVADNDIACSAFLTSKKAVVNHMVSQFQMKQARCRPKNFNRKIWCP